jgi:hypothetical protein
LTIIKAHNIKKSTILVHLRRVHLSPRPFSLASAPTTLCLMNQIAYIAKAKIEKQKKWDLIPQVQ